MDKNLVGGVMMPLMFAEINWGTQREEFKYHAVVPKEGSISGKYLADMHLKMVLSKFISL